MTTVLFMAGIGNSEPEHWQSRWKRKLPGSPWVEVPNWHEPRREEWVSALVRTAEETKGPKVIVAHSLGCLTFAEAAAELGALDVRGAFLVAPPDVEENFFPKAASGFRKASELSVGIPSLIVASTNDPYASAAYARALAECWNARFVEIGALGHINRASNLGDWDEGFSLFESFLREVE
jgi:predicted alpha/beta hydrolase family esterase